jgi:hypothetical protein
MAHAYFTLVAPRILRMLLDIWKIFVATTTDKTIYSSEHENSFLCGNRIFISVLSEAVKGFHYKSPIYALVI